MAPSIDSSQPQRQPAPASTKPSFDYKEVAIASMNDYSQENELNGVGDFKKASYPNYLPKWDKSVHFPPLEPFTHHDPGLDADPILPNLFPKGEQAYAEDITANIGAEVHGIQLSSFLPSPPARSDTATAAAKNELALYVARKRIVAFRDQDFADLPISSAVDFAKHFGRLHMHPTSPSPNGHPEVHLVHKGAGDTTASAFLSGRTNSTAWHTDISYEEQPPGCTFLYVLDAPAAGGDTLFSSMVEAYNRLSPAFRGLLRGLKAVHSGFEQAAVVS
ncbi:MAG: hypothetical protein M1831_006923 [Alyxoria varia]|nr:MAG: hypothetical protein M1831_006923 [Alyxoria varia]